MTDQTQSLAPIPSESRIFLSHEVQAVFRHDRSKLNGLRDLAEKHVREEPKGHEIWFKGFQAFNRSFGLTSSVGGKGTLDITIGFVPPSLRPRVVMMSDHRSKSKAAPADVFQEGEAE